MTLHDRLRSAVERSGLSSREIARRARLSENLVSQLLKSPTRSPRVDSVVAVAKVLGVSPAWLVTGETDNSAGDSVALEPWTPPDPGGQRQDLAARRERLLSTLAPQAQRPAGFRLGRDHHAFGLFTGDVLVIDLKMPASPGDLVVATTADMQNGTARTELRRFLPPYLLSPDPHEPDPQMVVDGQRTVVMGPVLASFRAPQLAGSD